MGLFVLSLGLSISLAQEQCCRLTVRVLDEENRPVSGAVVRIEEANLEQVTGPGGMAAFPRTPPGSYRLSVSRKGFLPLSPSITVEPDSPTEVDAFLTPEKGFRDSVTVRGEAPGVEEGASTSTGITGDQAKILPAEPPTVRDALPVIPGVVRTPEGKLMLNTAPEHRAALLVNSIDVTDPATGDFGATVPIDAVSAINVYKSPFLAEYGRFTAGVVAVDTKRGGDTWRYELNDPTPEFRIRSARVAGIRAFTPRFSFSGPVLKNRVYYSQSIEYILKKTPVFTLQFPRNEEKLESWNSLSQLDVLASAGHLLTFSFHGVPQKRNFVGLGFYNPQPVTPNFRGHEFRTSATDRAIAAGGVLESSLSFARNFGLTGAQGDEEFLISPALNTGNYFGRHDRRSERAQWLETYSPRILNGRGTHQLKAGGALTHAGMRGYYRANPITLLDFDGSPLRRIEFFNRDAFRLSDVEGGAFLQDHWQLAPALTWDFGMRGDWQRISGVGRIAPRTGLAWAPFGENGTVARAGLGWFYDRVPLSVYAFDRFPERTVFDILVPGSDLFGTPRRLRNITEPATATNSPFVFGRNRPGNFAPRSLTWNAQLDHRFPKLLHLRASYVQSDTEGLVVLRPGEDRMRLTGDGQAAHRQVELISRISWQQDQQVMFSYVRSWARGNLNDFAQFLGDFPAPLIRPDFIAESPGNIPHRFLAWGVIPLSPTIRVAPVAEYRTGFPYSALDALQDYAETPNLRRFPNFFSIDFRAAKDIHYRNHGFQVSFSMFNVTNHFNPDTVRWNTADPQFGDFFGFRRRRYRLDFDFLF